jgi:hypothetical protein
MQLDEFSIGNALGERLTLTNVWNGYDTINFFYGIILNRES